MNGKKITKAMGDRVLIEKLSRQELIHMYLDAKSDYNNMESALHATTLFDLTEECDYRGITHPAPTTNQIAAKLYPSDPIEGYKKNREAEYIAADEKFWQETEPKILPEGDRDKLELEAFCEVDKITRRLVRQTNTILQFPFFFKGKSEGINRKKVKVTIEVLED